MTIRLQDFTSARVGLGKVGAGLPTREWLRLQWAHARAREAVHSALDVCALREELHALEVATDTVVSSARDRTQYLQRPELGRQLTDEGRERLQSRSGSYDVTFVLADGLSALAVQRHGAPMLAALLRRLEQDEWIVAPVIVVQQGRVAIADEVAEVLGARMAVMLIGERPGLSSFDSLGCYLTWNARPGCSDADRNCVSNIRDEGLSYEAAAWTIAFLMNEARRLQFSGVGLKDTSQLLVE